MAGSPVEEVETFPVEFDETSLQVDTGLNSLQAIRQYATSPIYLQRMAYIQGMAAAAAEAGHAASTQVLLPIIEELIEWDDDEVREAVAAQLAPLASAWRASGGEAARADICSLLEQAAELLRDDSEEVAASAEAAVAGIAAALAPDDRRLQLLPILEELTSEEEEEDLVATAARLLAAIAPAFLPEECETEVLERLLILAGDPRYAVRKEAAAALGGLAPHLPPPACLQRLLPAYLALAADKIWAVRKECAGILAGLAALVPLEARRHHLVPLFDRLAGDVSHWVRNATLEHLGPFLATLEAADVSTGMLQQFCGMAAADVGFNDGALPLACAFNFPAVLSRAGAPAWGQLRPAYLRLVGSQVWRVRRSLAASMHEVAALLGPQLALQDLWPAVQDLAHDSLPEVQEGLQQNMAALLARLPPELRAVHVSLLAATLSHDCSTWRGRVSLVEQMGPSARLLDLQGLGGALLPCALTCCRDAVAAVREAAALHIGLLLADLCGRCCLQPHTGRPAVDTSATSAGNLEAGAPMNGTCQAEAMAVSGCPQAGLDAMSGAMAGLALTDRPSCQGGANGHADDPAEALSVLQTMLSRLCQLGLQPTYQLRQTFVNICRHLRQNADQHVVVDSLIPCLLDIAVQDTVEHTRKCAGEVLAALASQHALVGGRPNVAHFLQGAVG